MKTVKTVCQRDCPDTCFMDVHVDGNTVIATRGSRVNPITRGFLCPRGNADPQRIYSSERVLYPYARSVRTAQRPDARISWQAALDAVADRIRSTIAKHGREAILLYDYPGNTGLLAWHYPKRFWHALGATTTDYALCSRSGHTGIGLHYGLSYGLSLDHVAQSKVILFWGHNANISAPHLWALARRAQRRGTATIVCVDPRKSPTAAAADLWIQPRPGSDVALCYGIARHLIRQQGIDKAFIDRYTNGFQAYAQAADEWPPQRVTDTTGVAATDVARLAERLLSDRPAAFVIGLGLQKSGSGADAARAVSLLPALLGRHRGFHYSNGKGITIDWPMIDGSGLTDTPIRSVSQVEIGKRLASGEFKFIYVMGSNPAVTLPDQRAVRQGLDRPDVFVAVHDTHWSETACRADVVLPAATFFEKRDLTISDHHPYCRLSDQAIDPLGTSRPEIWVMQQLADRLKIDVPGLQADPWAVLESALAHTFRSGGLPELLGGEMLQVQLRPADSYQTRSGKIEFASASASGVAAPLPTQLPVSKTENEFVLLTSATANYTHSQFTDVYGPIPPRVWIHPADAARLAIKDDVLVSLSNDLAAITLHARVTGKVLPGSVWAPRPVAGLNGVPVNALVPGVAQHIGGGPIFNSVHVTIQPVKDI